MKSFRGALTLILMFGLLGAVGHPQKTGVQTQQTPTPTNPLPPLGADLPPGIAERQERARNEDRQKQLEADTDKLLQLATQLHTDVSKTNKNILSVDVIKRADEIEKLAHAVKERMRG
jgi:hypothetical protein